MFMSVHICLWYMAMYMYMYLYMCMCMNMYMRMCMFMYSCMCMYMYMHMYVYLQLHVYLHVYMHMHLAYAFFIYAYIHLSARNLIGEPCPPTVQPATARKRNRPHIRFWVEGRVPSFHDWNGTLNNYLTGLRSWALLLNSTRNQIFAFLCPLMH